PHRRGRPSIRLHYPQRVSWAARVRWRGRAAVAQIPLDAGRAARRTLQRIRGGGKRTARVGPHREREICRSRWDWRMPSGCFRLVTPTDRVRVGVAHVDPTLRLRRSVILQSGAAIIKKLEQLVQVRDFEYAGELGPDGGQGHGDAGLVGLAFERE